MHGSSYHLAPGVFARSGAVAVAGLVLVPLAVLAWRRRWASARARRVARRARRDARAVSLRAPVRRGVAVAVASRCRVPAVRVRVRGRRLGSQLPARDLRAAARARRGRRLPDALAGGLRLQARERRAGRGGRGSRRRRAWSRSSCRRSRAACRSIERAGYRGLAAALFLLPVAVHGFTRWDAVAAVDPHALTPGLVRALRDDVPKRGVVFSDLATSYRIAAAAPVLIVAAPPEHVADTKQNRPYERRKDVIAVLPQRRSRDPAALRRALARHRARRSRTRRIALRPVYKDARFALYRSHDRLAMTKVLLVTLYFPPAGGGGVQRPLKFATHLPSLGIETHVLAPDNPRWVHMDPELLPPTQAWVHRVRYLGPRGRLPSEELHGKTGLERIATQARLMPRRLDRPRRGRDVEPDGDPGGAEDRAHREDRRRDHDVAARLGAPRRRGACGARSACRWIADLRDSLLAHQDRRSDTAAVRLKGQTVRAVGGVVARHADAIVTAFDSIAEEMRALSPARPARDDPERQRLRRLRRAWSTRRASASGSRTPARSSASAIRSRFCARSRSPGLEDVVARFVGGFRAADREFADSLGLGDRVEVIPFVPRRRSLELQRDSEALLLIAADAGGRGTGVIPGKVFEYVAAGRPILAAVPPDGAAATLDRGDRRRRRRAGRRRRCAARGARRAARPLEARRAPRRARRARRASGSTAARALPSSRRSCTSSREGRRPDDVVPAVRGRRSRTVRGRRRRAAARARRRGGGRVAGVFPPLRCRVRRGRRRESAQASVARPRAAALSRLVRARRPARGAGRGRRPRALAAGGRSGARDAAPRRADRARDGRGARAPRASARARGRSAG